MSRMAFCGSMLLLLVSSCSKSQLATTSSGSPQANPPAANGFRSPTGLAKRDVESLQFALTTLKEDIGRYPSASEGLDALSYRPSNVANWHGPYIHAPGAKDPWGNAYVYVYPGVHNPTTFDLYSLGPDDKDAKGNTANNWSSVH